MSDGISWLFRSLWWFDAGVLLSLFFNSFSRVFGLMAEWIFDISVWRWRYGWTDIWTDLKMSARVEKSETLSNLRLAKKLSYSISAMSHNFKLIHLTPFNT